MAAAGEHFSKFPIILEKGTISQDFRKIFAPAAQKLSNPPLQNPPPPLALNPHLRSA